MDEFWDSGDQWYDESRCIVCKTRSSDLVCSATCEDVLSIRQELVPSE